MTIPTYQATGSFEAETGTATVPWPTHQAGDIGLLWVESANQTISLASAQGFVEVVQIGTGTAGAAGAVRLALFWCRATSGSMAPPVVADAGDHVYARMSLIRGAIATGNPWDVFTSDLQAGADTSIEVPGVTTTVTDTLVLVGCANATETGVDQVSNWANANLSSVTKRIDSNHGAGVGGGFSVASGGKATAGATGTTTGTLATSSAQARICIAIKPAGAVANPIPVFQAAGTHVFGVGSVTPAWPTHLENDIGLLFVESANETVTLTTANGFAEIPDSPQGTGTAGASGATRLTVFWCRATSASMASPVVADPGNHVIAQIVTFRGCETSGNPWDVTAGDVLSAASSTVTIPGDTTTVVNCLIVAISTHARDNTSPSFSGWANADLSNVVEITDVATDEGNGGGFGAAVGGKASAGAYGATTATLSFSTSQAVQGRISIALKPPAGSPPPTGDVSLPHRYWRMRKTTGAVSGPHVNEVELVERAGTVAGENSLIDAPAQLHPGISHFKAMFLVNQGGDGAAEFDLDLFLSTVPAGYVPSIPTDQVTRVVETFAEDDGVLKPSVGQNDGAAVLPLVKGVLLGTARHGDDVTFSDLGRVFQTVPLVEFSGGVTFSPGSTTAGLGFGTAAEVDAGTANDLADTAKAQSQDFSARDLTESGFTASLRLRQKGVITLRTLAFAGTALDAPNEADTISTLTNAPANNDTYHVRVLSQAKLRSKNGTTFRVGLAYFIETSINSGATWQTRATFTAWHATTSLTYVTLTGAQFHPIVVAGLTADGTDRIRIRLFKILTEGLGDYDASATWAKGGTGSTYMADAGVSFATSSDSFASATPTGDDVVHWKASGYV